MCVCGTLFGVLLMNGGHPSVPPVSGDTTRNFMNPLRCFFPGACAALGLCGSHRAAPHCSSLPRCRVSQGDTSWGHKGWQGWGEPDMTHSGYFCFSNVEEDQTGTGLGFFTTQKPLQEPEGAFCAGDPGTQSAFVQKHVESGTKAQTIRNALPFASPRDSTEILGLSLSCPTGKSQWF